MNKNELRIGNFVGLNDSEWNGFNQFFDLMDNSDIKMFLEDKNKHAKVTSVANEIELMAYCVDLDYYDLSEISPIKLTEEWLTKFGFEEDAESKSWSILTTLDKYDYQFEVSNKYQEYFQPDFVRMDIKYVHQLQNLFFALTGVDLQLSST